jgi:hypothetical protein
MLKFLVKIVLSVGDLTQIVVTDFNVLHNQTSGFWQYERLVIHLFITVMKSILSGTNPTHRLLTR